MICADCKAEIGENGYVISRVSISGALTCSLCNSCMHGFTSRDNGRRLDALLSGSGWVQMDLPSMDPAYGRSEYPGPPRHRRLGA
jgi:hypothetical protein